MEQLCNTEGSFLKKDSLIETLTNEGSRGSLTVPIPAFVNVLVYLEQVFRANVDEQNCFSKIKSNIDIDCVEDLLMPLDILKDCLWRICDFFIKIRCYQYARKLNTVHSKECKKTFRKSLQQV